MTVAVHSTNVHNNIVAKGIFKLLKDKFLYGTAKVFADSGYKGEPLKEWTAERRGWDVKTVRRSESNIFKVMPKKWMVESTFA